MLVTQKKEIKKYHRVSFYDSLTQSKRLNNAICSERSASQNSPCLSAVVSCLIESYHLGRKSLSAPEGGELGSPGCQRRWNVKPLTCILTLCHFDKSGWCSLSADWEWRGRSSWILDAGRQSWKERTENNFYSTRGGGYLCAWGVHKCLTPPPDNGVDMDSDRAKDKVNEGRQNKWREGKEGTTCSCHTLIFWCATLASYLRLKRHPLALTSDVSSLSWQTRGLFDTPAHAK